MMLQTLNQLFLLGIVLEIMYLFTCGQKYMKMSLLRARRSYLSGKVVYLLIGCVSIAGFFLLPCPEGIYVAFTGLVTVLFYGKCISVLRYRKRTEAS